jgi:hypothetical protein
MTALDLYPKTTLPTEAHGLWLAPALSVDPDSDLYVALRRAFRPDAPPRVHAVTDQKSERHPGYRYLGSIVAHPRTRLPFDSYLAIVDYLYAARDAFVELRERWLDAVVAATEDESRRVAENSAWMLDTNRREIEHAARLLDDALAAFSAVRDVDDDLYEREHGDDDR